jgi:hypothetical protein
MAESKDDKKENTMANTDFVINVEKIHNGYCLEVAFDYGRQMKTVYAKTLQGLASEILKVMKDKFEPKPPKKNSQCHCGKSA